MLKNFKNSILIFCVILLTFSCEKDDFCTQNPVTPKLILRFYEDANPTTLKAVQRFSSIAQSKTDSLFINQTIDSIAIPLNVNTTNTIYTFKKNEDTGSIATNKTAELNITYSVSYEYVSRSCGFKAIFDNVSITYNGWILNVDATNLTNINNQTKAHVQIFH